MNNKLLNNVDNIKDQEFLLWIRKKVQDKPLVDCSQYNLDELYNEYINQNSNAENVNNSSTIGSAKKKVLSNGPTVTPMDSNNQFVRSNNGAFTNWYGIILTLIFSFAIGYLIAWIVLKVR